MNLSLLLAAAVCFPSAPDLWKAGPLTAETLKIPAAEPVASEQQLQSQTSLFRQLRSPFQRSRMVIEFGEANTPAAFRILFRLLDTEKNAFVQDNILETLLRLQRKGLAVRVDDKQLIRFFNAPSPSARSAAALLYLGNSNQPDPAPVLEAFAKETSIPVLNRLLEALRPFASKISKSQIGNLYERTPSGNLGLRGVLTELAASQENPDSSSLLQKALQDPDPVIRMHAARGLAANPSGSKLLSGASADSHPAVRLAAARMLKPGPERIPILKTLLSDSSPAVRAAAARSLGMTGTNAAAELLTGALADAEIAVRRAAADALVRLKPAGTIHQRVVETGNAKPFARRQALAFLVQRQDQSQENTILRWIRTSKDPLFLREAAAALGSLNCRHSGKVLIQMSGSKDEQIRAAAADSMGKLKLTETFPALAKLCRDPQIKVAEAAFMSMYRISDRCFLPEFERMTGRFSEDGANCRSIACRALTAFPLKSKVIDNLHKLISSACIRVPMSGPMPDADHVRISALMLLREHARKGDPAAKKAYRENLTFLDRQKPESELKSRDLEEFIRQLKEDDARRPVKPTTIENVKPVFTTAPVGERE